jgi:hypothetical protein
MYNHGYLKIGPVDALVALMRSRPQEWCQLPIRDMDDIAASAHKPQKGDEKGLGRGEPRVEHSIAKRLETGFGIEPNSFPFTGSSTGLKPAAGASQLNQSYRLYI